MSSVTIVNYILDFTFCRFPKDLILVHLTDQNICIKVLSSKSITDPLWLNRIWIYPTLSLKSIWMDEEVNRSSGNSLAMPQCTYLGLEWLKTPENYFTGHGLSHNVTHCTGPARVSTQYYEPNRNGCLGKNLANSLGLPIAQAWLWFTGRATRTDRCQCSSSSSPCSPSWLKIEEVKIQQDSP